LNVQLRLFAVARDLVGYERLEVELADGATIRDLRQALTDCAPSLARLVPHLMFAINAEYAGDRTTIPAGAEVACIPPVSGG
jgi:molybdopterin synthase sulfur carrier subunit